MKELLLLPHLGLGDMLICNGMVRELAKETVVNVLCKKQNAASVRHMLLGVFSQEVIEVEDDSEAKGIEAACQKRGIPTLALGMHASPPAIKLPIQPGWDEVFYLQARVPFGKRWSAWHVERAQDEIEPPKQCAYIFVHDDPARGVNIKAELLPKRWKRIYADPLKSENIFAWRKVIEKAHEIHVMESCFAILADSLPDLKAKRLVIHAYARQSMPPRYKRNWEIIR